MRLGLGNLQCVGCVNGDDNTMAMADAFKRASGMKIPTRELAPAQAEPAVVGPVIDSVIGTVQAMTDEGWASILGAGADPVFTPPSVLPPGPGPTVQASGPSALTRVLLGAGVLFVAAKTGKLVLGLGAVAAYVYWKNQQKALTGPAPVVQYAQSQAPVTGGVLPAPPTSSDWASTVMTPVSVAPAAQPGTDVDWGGLIQGQGMFNGLGVFDSFGVPQLPAGSEGPPEAPRAFPSDATPPGAPAQGLSVAGWIGLTAAVLAIGSMLLKHK